MIYNILCVNIFIYCKEKNYLQNVQKKQILKIKIFFIKPEKCYFIYKKKKSNQKIHNTIIHYFILHYSLCVCI